MKRAIPIIAAIALIGIAIWLWTVLHPSPEKVIRSRLNALANAISFNSSGGVLGRAYDAQKAADFFTTDVDVDLNVAGYDSISMHGRDEVLQVALAARSRLTSLKVDFLDMNVTIDPGGETAKVNLTGKAVVPGERDISAQEFNFMLKKVDGKWLIYKVETVKTLSQNSMNSLRWIESIGSPASEIATKFLPLPGGEGRGEGERKHRTVHWQTPIHPRETATLPNSTATSFPA